MSLSADTLAELLRAPAVREAAIDLIAEALKRHAQAEPPTHVLLTGPELERAINLSATAVRAFRAEGMPHVMVPEGTRGNSPRYSLADVLGWLRARTEQNHSDSWWRSLHTSGEPHAGGPAT